MKTCYTKQVAPHRIAILDLIKKSEYSYIISRINVPENYRNLKHGSDLLDQCIKDADTENVTLSLYIYPSGSLNFTELKRWYERRNFIQVSWGFWERQPKKAKSSLLNPVVKHPLFF